MRRFLKIVGYLVATVVAIVAIALIVVYWKSGSFLKKTYVVKVQPVAVPTDPGSLAAGKHLAATRGCADCHGADLGGAKIFENFPIGRVHGSNITKGPGGKTANFTDEDWLRAIQHGVSKDGHGLFLMPSQEYQHFSEADLGNLIAYVKSVPPVARETVPVSIGPIGRILLLTGGITIAASDINHGAVHPSVVTPGVTVDYGRYLAIGCVGCHGPNYSGGKIPGGPPDWPPAQNLTPAGDLAKWNEADFFRALRTHVRPDGTKISEVMPMAFGSMTDDELRAIWMFMKTLPSAATASR